MSPKARTAYLIASSAPPVLQLDEFVGLLADRGWESYIILSPTAATWVDADHLAKVSRHPVRVEPRRPRDPDPLPPADVILAAPLTFNSLNKWATGISDTLALGLLNEALGLSLPVIAAPCVKTALRQHPVYETNVKILVSAGVTVLDPVSIVTRSVSGVVGLDWHAVLPE